MVVSALKPNFVPSCISIGSVGRAPDRALDIVDKESDRQTDSPLLIRYISVDRIGMGNAALAAAVLYPGKAAINFPQGTMR